MTYEPEHASVERPNGRRVVMVPKNGVKVIDTPLMVTACPGGEVIFSHRKGSRPTDYRWVVIQTPTDTERYLAEKYLLDGVLEVELSERAVFMGENDGALDRHLDDLVREVDSTLRFRQPAPKTGQGRGARKGNGVAVGL